MGDGKLPVASCVLGISPKTILTNGHHISNFDLNFHLSVLYYKKIFFFSWKLSETHKHNSDRVWIWMNLNVISKEINFQIYFKMHKRLNEMAKHKWEISKLNEAYCAKSLNLQYRESFNILSQVRFITILVERAMSLRIQHSPVLLQPE